MKKLYFGFFQTFIQTFIQTLNLWSLKFSGFLFFMSWNLPAWIFFME